MLQQDIAAPRVNIFAVVPQAETLYDFESGTSMATSHVSGIVVLLKSLHLYLSHASINSAIVTIGIYSMQM